MTKTNKRITKVTTKRNRKEGLNEVLTRVEKLFSFIFDW